QLPDDLLGCVTSSCHVVIYPPAPILAHQNSHNRRTCSPGSSQPAVARTTHFWYGSLQAYVRSMGVA
ncbi:hypothetical protein, partial [Nocardia vermiculata]|uniref:hypothetical protein n=1 Tax=Nocardia vermiculata TaxID=257274 RepID=UPI001B34A7B3